MCLARAVFISATVLSLVGLSEGCDSRHYAALSIPLGQKLPVLELQSVTGKPVNFPTNTGKLLIINVWATWCGPCRHELPSLDRLSKVLGTSHATVIGVSVDNDSHVLREYLIERRLSFTTYRDKGRQIADKLLGIHVFPTTLIVGPDGTLLKVVQGWRTWDSPDLIAELKALLPANSKELKSPHEISGFVGLPGRNRRHK